MADLDTVGVDALFLYSLLQILWARRQMWDSASVWTVGRWVYIRDLLLHRTASGLLNRCI
jgi:hypothetical protein